MATKEEKPTRLDFIAALQTLAGYSQVGQLANIYRMAADETKQLVENAILQAIDGCGYRKLVELLGEEGISGPIREKGIQRLKKLGYEAIRESERLQRSLEILSDPRFQKTKEANRRMTGRALAGIEFEVPLEGDLEKTVESMSRLPYHVEESRRMRRMERARQSARMDGIRRTFWSTRRIAISHALGVVGRYMSGNAVINFVDDGKKIRGRRFSARRKNRQKLKS